MALTRRNHYVPVWYQRRFLRSGENSFFFLDLCPEGKMLPDGRIITIKNLHCWGPQKCFWEKDLYTTVIFGIPNDEIERYLFGSIDRDGSEGIRALLNRDFGKLHHYFSKIFEYLDAQKIRTPKGLDWIKSHYPHLSYMELLYEMQALRKMHCTMWVEAVREIVSAEDSSVKFIISDHPVAIYSRSCPPDSPQCRYPEDPSIALKSSQTIFPLDLDHCLILTNLEYAREPNQVDPLSSRTHARYFGETLVRFDTIIRERRLRENEVAAINLIIKARARKYIAAAKEDWLFPEAVIHLPWAEIGKVLLPPEKGLWQFGGEIYVGGEDGKLIHYQDEFGRSYGEMSHLKKEVKWEKIGRNDLCPCGSGKKYKKCCLNKPLSQRPSSTELSIRERNIVLFRAVTDILGLAKGKTWLDVRRDISDEKVREIHKVFGSLWPKETNLMNLLPYPNSSILRALYAGLVDPRLILRNVVGFSLYFDEIIVLSPFTNPACVKEEYSPIHSPSQFKQETLKNVLLFLQLAPFIESGIVHMIPDPSDFDYNLRKETWEMASERLKSWQPDKKEFKAMEPLFKDDFVRSMWGLPEESLKHQVKKALPDKSDEEIGLVLEYIKEIRTQDPLALLQPIQAGKEGGQLLITHLTPNLELGLFLAQIMGAFIFTDNSLRWDELLGALSPKSTTQEGGWELVARSLSSLRFNFLDHVDPRLTLAIRRSGKLGDLRKLLRQIWMNIQNDSQPERANGLAQEVIKQLRDVHARAQAEWNLIQNELLRKIEDPVQRFSSITAGSIEFKIPPGGFAARNVYRLLLTHSGRTDYLKCLPMAAFVKFPSD